MARSVATDYLQPYAFWMMDLSLVTGQSFSNGLPVFSPLMGFSSITAPKVTVNIQTITEGNGVFPRKVVKDGSIGGFTATRGVTFMDSEFWRWTMAGLTGQTDYQVGGTSYRRDLLILHFFSRSPIPGHAAQQFVQGLDQKLGPFSVAMRIPAKAYLLSSCIPTSWVSGPDFNATSSEISVAEVGFECEGIQEISLSSNPLVNGNSLVGAGAGVAAGLAQAFL